MFMNLKSMESVLLASAMSAAALADEAQPPVVLGVGQHEAAKFDVEYQKYDRMQPVFKENGIQASLFDMGLLYRPGAGEEQILKELRKFHVIHLNTTTEEVPKITPELEAHAKVAGSALAKFVSEGGGLFIAPQNVRYSGDKDEQYNNMLMEGIGAEILHEGCFDKTSEFEGTTLAKAKFWMTSGIAEHPVTEGLRNLCLPLHNFGDWPGVAAMKYSKDWEPVVKGGKDAKSYRCGTPGNPNTINLAEEGFYGSEPPVVAVRTLGKGRIVCYPLAAIFTGQNFKNPVWASVVESKGDAISGRPSDSMKLQMNAYRWLAEPARQNPELGTFRPEPYKPVEFKTSVDFDAQKFNPSSSGQIKAVVGARTAYSDGKSTVAEYAAAAKAAGVSVVVFADPLEMLTKDELDKLKSDCAAACEDGRFYACPGIEFTDGAGVRWAMWGEKIVYPPASFENEKKTYAQWDGKRLAHFGQYAELCGFSPCAIIDYAQLRKAGAHPENLWWFYCYFPLAYDHGKLIADNYGEFLMGLRDMRWCSLLSFDRIGTAQELAKSAELIFTGFSSVGAAKKALNTRCAPFWDAWAAQQFVSQGPVIRQWDCINNQMEENWRYTKGAQRVRLLLDVASDAGIKEVIVHDADRTPLRRYDAKGAKEFVREFETVHDQQRYLTLEVVDVNGKRAFSHYILVFCYKQGLFRCGDNLNILGATGMCWHPDRHELFSAAKSFVNAYDFSLAGWDSAGPVCPLPRAWIGPYVNTDQVREYPLPWTSKSMLSLQMDVKLSSYNIQHATMKSSMLTQPFCTDERPQPALCSVSKDIGPNEYFEYEHTIYAPEERLDYYVIWNYRRAKEGRANYRGGVIWHEGKIKFKKDVKLKGGIPIHLYMMDIPTDLARNWGDTAIVTDADGTAKVDILADIAKPINGQGRLRPGGYAAQMPTQAGFLAFYAPSGTDFAYSYHMPNRLYIGLGKDNQELKAGDEIPFRFMTVVHPTEQFGTALMEKTLKSYNLAGGRDGYPLSIEKGEIEDAVFLLTLKAEDGEALFTAGPQELVVDLPLRIKGVADNGCAAVHSSGRPWFRFVPVCEGAALFQESIEKANKIWVGNVFVCDNPDVMMTLVVDGQAEGKKPFIEVHNPTDKELKAVISSPEKTPVFGGTRAEVAIPPEESVFYEIDGGKLVERKR